MQVAMNVDTGMNRALTLVAGSHPAIVQPAEGPVRKSCPNPVAGRDASTLGVGLFRERRVVVDYPGRRLFLP